MGVVLKRSRAVAIVEEIKGPENISPGSIASGETRKIQVFRGKRTRRGFQI